MVPGFPLVRRAAYGLVGLLLSAGSAPPFQEERVLGQYQFRSYTSDEGLDSLGVWSMAQDREGFLWVGTDTGLYRFDGFGFQHWGAKQGLKGDMVQAMLADPKGGLWYSNSAGLQRLEGGIIRSLGQAEGLPESRVEAMAYDDCGRLWLAFGSAVFVQEAAGFRKQERLPFAPEGLAWAPRHGGMAMGLGNRVALVRPDGSLAAWGSSHGLGPGIRAVLEDGDGTLWALGQMGLYSKPLGQDRWESLTHPRLAGGQERLRSLCPDGRGGLWASTGGGLFHVRQRRWHSLGTAQGLPTLGAGLALVDHEGSLWYAGSGLYRQLGLGAWRNFTTHQGLPTELAWALARDRRGTMWAGTDRGLAWLDQEAWKLLPGTEGVAFNLLVELADGTVAGLGDAHRLLKVSRATGRPTLISRGDSRNPCLSVLRDPEGRLWSLGPSTLERLEERGGRLHVAESLPVPRDAFTGGLAGATCDREGRFWFATAHGFSECDRGSWRRWDRSQGLLSDDLGSLASLPDGSYLAVYRTSLGITRFVREANRLRVLRHYREADGSLPTDAVFSAHVGTDGRIWLNTNLGVVELGEKGFRVFGRTSGFLNQDTVQGAFWADPGGRLWFGTGGGIVAFDPAAYPWDLSAPRPVIARAAFGARSLTGAPEPGLRLPPSENTVEFHLGCLSYSREKSFRLETRLLGLDADWRAERSPHVRYPALSPGAYTLEARVVSDGQAGPVLAFPFEILPRWYQTWTVRILGFLALGPLLWGVLVWRNRALKSRNLHLEALVRVRTADLENANRILEEQNLHDPLTGLWNRRYLTLTLPEQAAHAQRVLQPNWKRPLRPELFPDHPLLFMVLDLDHFKRVNDEFGHQAGDEVLRGVADLLKDLMRESDTVARWGGEEFIVVARQVSMGDPAAMAERIRKAIEGHEFVLEGGRSLKQTLSIGYCPYPLGFEAPALPWEKAVMLADRALYAAKRNGRNGWIGLAEGPSFQAAILQSSGGHPDIGNLLEKGVLHIEHSYPHLGEDLWI